MGARNALKVVAYGKSVSTASSNQTCSHLLLPSARQHRRSMNILHRFSVCWKDMLSITPLLAAIICCALYRWYLRRLEAKDRQYMQSLLAAERLHAADLDSKREQLVRDFDLRRQIFNLQYQRHVDRYALKDRRLGEQNP